MGSKMMAKSPSPYARRSVADLFRGQIEKAEADGVERSAMILRLTFSDAQQLKRDPGVALTDISFADGAMRYLGVKVEQGGPTQSALDHSAS